MENQIRQLADQLIRGCNKQFCFNKYCARNPFGKYHDFQSKADQILVLQTIKAHIWQLKCKQNSLH